MGLRDPEVRESREIPKFGNPESRKSQSRNFGIPEIPKISIPNFRDSRNPENFGIPELRDPENFRDFPKIPENYAYVHFNSCCYYLRQQKVPFSCISGLKILADQLIFVFILAKKRNLRRLLWFSLLFYF